MIVAGTGHRPPYLLWGYSEEHPLLTQLKSDIAKELRAVKPDVVISGMASGFDTYLAEVALQEGVALETYTVIGQTETWPLSAKRKWDEIVEQSTNYPIASVKELGNKAYFERDIAMVDDADLILALLNPEQTRGGTRITVTYAQRKVKNVVNLWKDEYKAEKDV